MTVKKTTKIRRRKKIVKRKITIKNKKPRDLRHKNPQGSSSIKSMSAERLRKAGYTTIEKIANASPDRLAKVTGLKKILAQKLISSAKELNKEKPLRQPSKERQIVTEKEGTLDERILSEAIKNERFIKMVAQHVADDLF